MNSSTLNPPAIAVEFDPPLPIADDDFRSRILTLTIEEGAHEPSRFEIELADPNIEFWDLEPSIIGRTVTIRLDETPPFRGLVVGRRLRRDSIEGTRSILWGLDFGVRLLGGPHFRAFYETSIQTVVQSLCARCQLEAHIEGLPDTRIKEPTTIVQYDESDLSFLQRQASLIGVELWFWRCGLYFGAGPGAAHTFDAHKSDLSKRGSELGAVFLDEDWTDEPASFSIPLHGTLFESAPRLPPFTASEPLPKTEALPETQNRPSTERRVFEKLRSSLPIDWPSTVAVTAGQRSSTASLLASARRKRRLGGAIHWRGSLPKEAIPGCSIRLTRSSSRPVGDEAVIFGVKQVYSGSSGQEDCILQLGRLGPIRDTFPDLRPAQHLWPARVVGTYKNEVGAIVVAPIGWHADSRLPARILSTFAGKDFAAVSVPCVGDLGIVGFEGGSPDAPVWLGSLHDKDCPVQVTSKGQQVQISPQGEVRGAVQFAGGAGTAFWEAKPGHNPKKVRVELNGIDFELVSDSAIHLKTKGSSLTMTANPLELQGDINLASKNVTVQSEHVTVQKFKKLKEED